MKFLFILILYQERPLIKLVLGVVRSDDVLKRALEAVQRELNLTKTGEEDKDDLTGDPFADMELED